VLFLSEHSLAAMLTTCLDVTTRVVRDCVSFYHCISVICSTKNRAGRKLLQRQRSSWNTGDISHSPLAWHTIKTSRRQRARHQRAVHIAGLLSTLQAIADQTYSLIFLTLRMRRRQVRMIAFSSFLWQQQATTTSTVWT